MLDLRILPFVAVAALAPFTSRSLAVEDAPRWDHDPVAEQDPVEELDPGAAQNGAPAAAVYDPLAVEGAQALEPLDLEAEDVERERTLPLRVWLPPVDEGAAPTPAPVVLFSHGLGGSREGNPYLGRHWAARGYAVVFVQHPGSDAAVWRDVPRRDRMRALQAAASAEQYLARVADIPAVLDALEIWNADGEHPLHGRFDLERVGMSGHSFGAVTTQAVSGQAARGIGQHSTDPRIDAAVAMSPSTPARGAASVAFGSVAVPWLLMTGTHDDSPIGDTTPESRREVYPHLPSTIDRFELVLDGAEHSAFGDRALPDDDRPRNPNHHRAVLALSTAFWDAYLGEEDDARAWLHGDGPRGVLEEADLWQAARAEAR